MDVGDEAAAARPAPTPPLTLSRPLTILHHEPKGEITPSGQDGRSPNRRPTRSTFYPLRSVFPYRLPWQAGDLESLLQHFALTVLPTVQIF